VFQATTPLRDLFDHRRQPVYADNVVASSQPLATQAGIEMLRRGGNAVDAAIASAIALTVVEPTSNGIGSDAFAIVWDGQVLHGLNASGRSPASWSPDRFAHLPTMPLRGWESVTIPGAVSAWVELSARFGKIPFQDLFEPAIHYARDGYPLSPITAAAWGRSVEQLHGFEEFMRVFAPSGRAPRAGERVGLPDHARTLAEIAQSRGESFYCGELAQRIAGASGGWIAPGDLSEHRCDWVGTLSAGFYGVELHEIPPNGQGLAALIALRLIEQHAHNAGPPPDAAHATHIRIEAMKLALADAHRFVSDPTSADIDVRRLLSDDYIQARARLIDPARAQLPAHGVPHAGDTVCLAAADAGGMMVSYIQSNYFGFGSGIVVPGTGIALQNRGHGFVTTPGHPNQVGPRKRPFHTIIPGFVMRGKQPVMAFGVMGGPMQAQGHVQMMQHIFQDKMNPQLASDQPRWQCAGEMKVLLERGFDAVCAEALDQMAHQVLPAGPEEFGGAQLILKLPDGSYVAGSDHRKDGMAAGF
jgi:gamma-glutamyltranspeptidase/glutathione hydrolase